MALLRYREGETGGGFNYRTTQPVITTQTAPADSTATQAQDWITDPPGLPKTNWLEAYKDLAAPFGTGGFGGVVAKAAFLTRLKAFKERTDLYRQAGEYIPAPPADLEEKILHNVISVDATVKLPSGKKVKLQEVITPDTDLTNLDEATEIEEIERAELSPAQRSSLENLRGSQHLVITGDRDMWNRRIGAEGSDFAQLAGAGAGLGSSLGSVIPGLGNTAGAVIGGISGAIGSIFTKESKGKRLHIVLFPVFRDMALQGFPDAEISFIPGSGVFIAGATYSQDQITLFLQTIAERILASAPEEQDKIKAALQSVQVKKSNQVTSDDIEIFHFRNPEIAKVVDDEGNAQNVVSNRAELQGAGALAAGAIGLLSVIGG